MESFIPALTVATPILVAIFGGIFAWLAGSKKGSADAQNAIVGGFEKLFESQGKLIASLTIANNELKAEVKTLQEKVDLQSDKIDTLTEKIGEMEADRTMMTMYANELERIIKLRGEEPPPRPAMRVN